MTEKINVRGVNFDSVDLQEALDLCIDHLNSGDAPFVIHTPNSEIVQLCIEKREYYEIINSADLIIPDGVGVILASKIKKTPLKKGKVAGIELCEKLAEYAAREGIPVYFLGGKPSVAEAAYDALAAKYPGLVCAGASDGYFKKQGEESDAVIEKINASGAGILFVCLGCPAQEVWMYENRGKIKVRLMGGFGGSFDVFSGSVKRAPKLFIKLGLEWLYRLLKEPSRIGRMMKLPKFLIGTLFSKK